MSLGLCGITTGVKNLPRRHQDTKVILDELRKFSVFVSLWHNDWIPLQNNSLDSVFYYGFIEID